MIFAICLVDENSNKASARKFIEEIERTGIRDGEVTKRKWQMLRCICCLHSSLSIMRSFYSTFSRSLTGLSQKFKTDILALGGQSKILGRCWALSEFHISSCSFSNQFLSTVLVCGASPQTGLKASDNFQYIPATAKNLTLATKSKDIWLPTPTVKIALCKRADFYRRCRSLQMQKPLFASPHTRKSREPHMNLAGCRTKNNFKSQSWIEWNVQDGNCDAKKR